MGRDKPAGWWMAAAALVHLAMFGYDLANPTAFMHTDRAGQRMEAVQGMLASFADGSTLRFLAANGNPGDYLPQALLFGALGQYGLILFQVGLALLSARALYDIARMLGMRRPGARTTALAWLALPHTLVFPHQLASEAIYSPLLVLSVWLLARAATRRNGASAARSGFVVGLANLVRPVTLLWPLLVALLFARAGRGRAGAWQLAFAAVPVLLWMGFMAAQTGTFTMGESSRDLGHNLYQRVLRMTQTLPAHEAAAARARYLAQGDIGSLPVGAYLRFAATHPAPFARHAVRDTAVFLGKSGIERLTIDYLPLAGGQRGALQDSRGGWRARLENAGLAATLGHLWQTQGIVLVLSAAGSALMLAFSLATLYGALALWRDRFRLDSGQRLVAAMLASLPLYVLVFSQLVDALQSRHRAPAEAAMVLVSAYGVAHWARRRAERRAGRAAASAMAVGG